MIAVAASAPAVEVRAAWPEDQAFVAATFREQLGRGHALASDASTNRLVDRVLDSNRTRVVVACEGRRLVGWLAYVEMPRVRALLFAYVRKPNRGQGIASAMAAHAWPRATGQWVHAGLRGGSARQLLERFGSALEMPLEEML